MDTTVQNKQQIAKYALLASTAHQKVNRLCSASQGSSVTQGRLSALIARRVSFATSRRDSLRLALTAQQVKRNQTNASGLSDLKLFTHNLTGSRLGFWGFGETRKKLG